MTQPMTLPSDAIAAVTHPDPYPFYAELVAARPIYFDAGLGLWVASSAAAVGAVLASPLCRVRPTAEPIPHALLGSPAGQIFGHLVRMSDGAQHGALKPAVTTALAATHTEAAADVATGLARLLLARDETGSPGYVAFALPVLTIARLIGLPDGALEQLPELVDDFVRCLSPISTGDQIERSKLAARRLLDLVGAVPPSVEGGADGIGRHCLHAMLARAAGSQGQPPDERLVANTVGFLSQTYEATAGLIGNTLLALHTRPQLRAAVAAAPDLTPDQLTSDQLTADNLIADIVREALRFDSSVQNTRRFVDEAGVIAGERMKAGDAILVVLAAANRDPAANPDPHRFDAARDTRRIFSFGAARHACPGETLAVAIAAAGVRAILACDPDLVAVTLPPRYRASVNTRVPLLPGAAQFA